MQMGMTLKNETNLNIEIVHFYTFSQIWLNKPHRLVYVRMNVALI